MAGIKNEPMNDLVKNLAFDKAVINLATLLQFSFLILMGIQQS